ncbi:MAG: GtrA family protein [Pseudomonadota bacterium]
MSSSPGAARRGLWAQLLRFLGVGVVATLVHVSVALLATGAGVPLHRANLTGFATAFLVSYAGHFRVTFGLAGTGALHGVHLPRFLAVSAVSLGLSTGLVEGLGVRAGAPAVVVMAAIAVVVPGVTFALSRLWAFRLGTGTAPGQWAGILLAVAAGAAAFVTLRGQAVNHDTAWYLVATRTWLDGASLYDGIMEINPPLAFYLTVPVIWLADGLGLSDPLALNLWLSGLTAISLLWIWVALAPLPSAQRMALVGAIGAALMLTLRLDAGQRDHMLMILALPWLMGWIAAPGGGQGPAAVARAAVAALGICLKPHFLILPLALTSVECVRARSLSPVFAPGNLTIAGLGAAYVGAVALFHTAWFTEVVPMGALVYHAYGNTTLGLVLEARPVWALAALAVLWPIRHSRAGLVMCTLVVAGLVSILAQGKGFGYHAIPLVVAMAGAFGLAIARDDLWWMRSLAAVGALVLGVSVGAQGRAENPIAELAHHVEEAGPKPVIMSLATDLWVGFPLVLETGAVWASRYPTLWLVPGALDRLSNTDCVVDPETCARLESILDRSRQDTLDDIAEQAPDLLLVDTRHRHHLAMRIDHLGLLRQDPRAEALLAPYEKVDEMRGLQVWRRVR